jgi:hypothetical protein
MASRNAMNEKFGLRISQRSEGELNSLLQQLWRFYLEIVVGGIKQHSNSECFKGGIIRLPRHIDYVRDPGASHRFPLLIRFYPASYCNPIGDPTDIEAANPLLDHCMIHFVHFGLFSFPRGCRSSSKKQPRVNDRHRYPPPALRFCVELRMPTGNPGVVRSQPSCPDLAKIAVIYACSITWRKNGNHR